MTSRTSVVTISAVLALAAGVAASLVMGSRSARIAGVQSSGSEQPRLKSVPTESPVPDTIPVEVKTVALDTSVEVSSDQDRTTEEVWKLMTSLDQDQMSPSEKRSRLRKLRPEMAEFFIRRFRASNTQGRERQMSVELAMSCGGTRAASFLEELATENSKRFPGTPFWFAASVLDTGHIAPRPREFPVNESLMVRTQIWRVSQDKEERRMAMAVLGFSDPALGLPLLLESVMADPDPYLRQAAVRQLGRIGNAGTLAFLRTHRESLGSEMYKLYKPTASSDGMAMVLSPDYFSRSITDAIEELEERLAGKGSP